MPTFNAESTFAMRIRQHRLERGWSQAELASRMSKLSGAWDQATIARIEKGARRIQLNDAFLMAAMFGKQVEDLLDEMQCEACQDFPPAGYACQTCGTSR